MLTSNLMINLPTKTTIKISNLMINCFMLQILFRTFPYIPVHDRCCSSRDVHFAHKNNFYPCMPGCNEKMGQGLREKHYCFPSHSFLGKWQLLTLTDILCAEQWVSHKGVAVLHPAQGKRENKALLFCLGVSYCLTIIL